MIETYPSKAKTPLLSAFYGACVALVVAGYLAASGNSHASGALGVSGALFEVAAAFSAGLGAWMKRTTQYFEEIGDENRFWPPSSVTRELFTITDVDGGVLARLHTLVAWDARVRNLMLWGGFSLVAISGFF